MYISAPPGTVALAGYLLPEEEYEKLSREGFNSYGEEKSLTILQFMRDLEWIYISYEESGLISLKPTERGLDFFEKGVTEDFMKGNGNLYTLIKKYLSEFTTEQSDLTEVTLNLAEYYTKSGNYTRAIDLGSNLIAIGNKTTNLRLLGRAHHIYGLTNMFKLDLDFAQSHFEKTIFYAEKCNEIQVVAKGYLGLGSVCGYLQNYEKSIEYFEKAYLLFKEVNDVSGMNQVKFNEAYAYGGMAKIEEFFTLNHEAIDYFKSVGDKHNLQYCYLNESVILLTIGKTDMAIDSVVEAYETAREIGSKRILNLAGLSIARIYILTNRPGNALEYLDQAYNYFRMNFDTNGVGLCHDLYASYDIATKNEKAAEENLERMEKNYRVKRLTRRIVDAYAFFIRTMKNYHYSEEEINKKISLFRNKISEEELKSLFDEMVKEIFEEE